MTSVLAVAFFAVTWALIAFRRLRWLPIGRPAGALAGAVGMVVVGALTPAEALGAIDLDTIALLLGMMIVTAYLQRSGLFEVAASRSLTTAGTPIRLLLAVAWASAILSAVLVNDTVCLFLTPLVVGLGQRARLPLGPLLLALATSANLGSAATLIGNPQNMLIGSLSSIGFATFAWRSLPAVAVALIAHSALLVWFFRARLGSTPLPVGPPPGRLTREAWRVLAAVAIGLGALLAGLHLGFTALAVAVALLLFERRDPRDVLAAVDGSLLLFFAGLFVVVAGLEATGLPAAAWEAVRPWMSVDDAPGIAALTATLLVGSNIVSNVPLVLLVGEPLEALGRPELSWVLLGYVTTVAGNFTLVGSVANVIVAEQASEHYELSFWEYARFGVPSTLLSLAVGVPTIVFLAS